ncbi:MAG TPA: selenocysteine-specific translation elongation factor [Candidatus Sulfopaludibacter sp.]|jgi:selenocysteine-specific elongation factor|nr:selenocysteine-specific translation elongation factor [Candidatus Sulfopaludibacter sp.]
MKHIIAGTAGHIDHGKTALVKALTGIDADRLEEEKRRGITIDLGFAHLQLTPSVRLAFVDVPGHERFVKNMLAGVGGIDLVVFVIAADESIKPQTREHFDICRLLGIPRGIIALTKADLVDPDILGLVKLEVEELVAGSFLEGAPMVPVSSVTGAGLDDLRKELARAATTVPEKNAGGHFRMPIDRVFSVKGFGTVVTGTMISGSVDKEREVQVYPSGRHLRVRGVEVHGSKAERAVAGQRTALNLADIEAAELKRGDVLSGPDLFQAVHHLDCRLDLLASAKPLKHRAPVHFHSGTAEIEAEVRLFGGAASMAPGTTCYVRIVLREPALLLPGDRFIIRKFSPVVTIGGGVVVDIGERRYRKTDDVAGRLTNLGVASLVREAEFGLGIAQLVARTGRLASEIAAAAAQAPLLALTQPQPWYVDRAWFQASRDRLVRAVREFHRANPLLAGVAKQDLRSRELPGSPLFILDALLADAKDLIVDGETVRSRGHAVVLQQDEQEARGIMERAFEQSGLAVPALAEVLAKSGVEQRRARSLLEILLREKRLVRISEDLVFHHSALEQLRQMLSGRRGTRFQVGAFKEWTGISRKYAIPLLEFLDREHVTRRDGDERLVL